MPDTFHCCFQRSFCAHLAWRWLREFCHWNVLVLSMTCSDISRSQHRAAGALETLPLLVPSPELIARIFLTASGPPAADGDPFGLHPGEDESHACVKAVFRVMRPRMGALAWVRVALSDASQTTTTLTTFEITNVSALTNT